MILVLEGVQSFSSMLGGVAHVSFQDSGQVKLDFCHINIVILGIAYFGGRYGSQDSFNVRSGSHLDNINVNFLSPVSP